MPHSIVYVVIKLVGRNNIEPSSSALQIFGHPYDSIGVRDSGFDRGEGVLKTLDCANAPLVG